MNTEIIDDSRVAIIVRQFTTTCISASTDALGVGIFLKLFFKDAPTCLAMAQENVNPVLNLVYSALID